MVPKCPDCKKPENECSCDENTKQLRRIKSLEAEVLTLHGAIDGWRRTQNETNEDLRRLREFLSLGAVGRIIQYQIERECKTQRQ